nr:MAG: RNA-dependent RNA polymerase [Leptosphaeria biglobosa mitovirus 2]
MVKVDMLGLPKIIPFHLRKFLINFKNTKGSQREVIGILTVLSIFRVFPTRVKPSLSSVTQPFNGLFRTFTVPKEVYKELGLSQKSLCHLRPAKLINAESSGPNSYKAIWGGVIDALALLHHPKPFINYCLATSSHWVLIYVITIWVFLGPLYFVIYSFTGSKSVNGRLSVVYDQAGKARVVAITSYWLQLLLKPLHDKLFLLLGNIQEDGTFNQSAPLDKLVFVHRLNTMMNINQRYHCFDLSAATDRLPIDIQSQVLTDLGFDGERWKQLLDIPWLYKKTLIRYSIGQPMGAYSSWAMLALTHHIIVKTCAIRKGITGFKDYAILGDDVVIYNDIVADEYLSLMQGLGLEINLSKTVQSYDFAEFAKRWLGHNIDISPIGPGLLLQSLRNKSILSTLIMSLLSRNIHTYEEVYNILMHSPRFVGKQLSKVIGGLLLFSIRVSSPEHANERSYERARAWLSGVTNSPSKVSTYEIREFFRLRALRILKKNLDEKNDEISFLLRNCFRQSVVRNRSFIIFDTLFFFLNPGFYFYLRELIFSKVEIQDRIFIIEDLPTWLSFSYPRHWADLSSALMDMGGETNIATLNWEKRNVKDLKKVKHLSEEFLTAVPLRQRAVEQFRLMNRP